MAGQRVWTVENDYSVLEKYLTERNVRSILLVCGSSFESLTVGKYINECAKKKGIRLVKFSEFSPNPKYEEVVNGTALLREEQSDLLMAVGGGSAIDVAKCMKLYKNLDPSLNYLDQEVVANSLPFLVIPTTAGTGSEATRFAVIYYHGEKLSIAHESSIPGIVLLDASVLKSVPEYQRKATMLDALCHAVESFWSVHSTEESKKYSKQAICLILENKESYLKNDEAGNKNMLLAANLAGKAINITQTTAGHAMCYKLTSLYGIAHGHAAALCVAVLWKYMIQHVEYCIDVRGKQYLKTVFQELAFVMGGKNIQQGAEIFCGVLHDLKMEIPKVQEEDFVLLKRSVNLVRLKNNPIHLSELIIDSLYHRLESLY